VELGDDYHITLLYIRQEQRELGPIIAGTAHCLLENLIALGQRLKLGIQALTYGADTCVTYQCHGLLPVNRARYTDSLGQKPQRDLIDLKREGYCLKRCRFRECH